MKLSRILTGQNYLKLIWINHILNFNLVIYDFFPVNINLKNIII